MLSENRRVSPVQEATYDGEGPEELLLTIGRRPRELMSASVKTGIALVEHKISASPPSR